MVVGSRPTVYRGYDDKDIFYLPPSQDSLIEEIFIRSIMLNLNLNRHCNMNADGSLFESISRD